MAELRLNPVKQTPEPELSNSMLYLAGPEVKPGEKGKPPSH